jgi:hypothetical protein
LNNPLHPHQLGQIIWTITTITPAMSSVSGQRLNVSSLPDRRSSSKPVRTPPP